MEKSSKKLKKVFDKRGMRCYYSKAVAKRSGNDKETLKKVEIVVDKRFELCYNNKVTASRAARAKIESCKTFKNSS